MLQTIIPPIVVVLSLIGIIIFLVKKAPQIALLEDNKDIGAGVAEASKKKTFLGKLFFQSQSGENGNFKHGLLFFLEKFTRKLRVFFLKLENLFTHWSESLKRKRKDHIELNDQPEGEGNDFEQDEIAEKARNHEIAKSVYNSQNSEIKVRFKNSEIEEKIVKPMLSEKVTVPRNKPEIKNRLERILIERIASNPKDTEAYERLGEYYFEIENFQHSKECFKQVIKLDPMNISVKDKMRRLERLLARR